MLDIKSDSKTASSGLAAGGEPRVRVVDRLDALPRDTWESLFPGEPESWDFYRSGDDAPPPGFKLGAICVEQNGQVVAAAPLFRTVFRFDTSVQNATRRKIGDWMFANMPGLISVRVLGLGSPLTDICHIGFAPALSDAQRMAVLGVLLDGLKAQAAKENVPLLAAKALTTPLADALQPVFTGAGYTRVTSIPVVMLNLPFRNEAHYLSSLPERTAAYLKRKFRPMSKLRIEYRNSIEGLEDTIHALYEETLNQSAVDYGEFGHVARDFFPHVLRNMGDKARFMLCWLDDELLSFQLYVSGPHDLVAKSIGMRYPQAKDYNLYFINWLMMIRFALDNDKSRICMGGTTYHTKMLFGGRIEKRWIFFRFRNPVLNALLPWLAPAFDFEKNDPELNALAAREAAEGPKS